MKKTVEWYPLPPALSRLVQRKPTVFQLGRLNGNAELGPEKRATIEYLRSPEGKLVAAVVRRVTSDRPGIPRCLIDFAEARSIAILVHRQGKPINLRELEGEQ